MSRKELPWYDDRVTQFTIDLTPSKPTENCKDSSSPKGIYSYLHEHIWGQEEAKKAAAMLMWKTLRGIRENIMFCGPSGCGKTELFRQLRARYPDRVVIEDASNLTMDGWKGGKKWTTLLSHPNLRSREHAILVLDEADKLFQPRYSMSENISELVLAEGLTLLEGSLVNVTRSDVTWQVDTSRISFVFLGAFSRKAADLAEKSRGATIGFGAEPADAAPYPKPLTVQDIVDFRATPEFMGRIQRVVNLQPMTREDFAQLLFESAHSPIRKLEELYRIRLHLSREKCLELAQSAHESGLGVREITNQLVALIDNGLFDAPERRCLEL